MKARFAQRKLAEHLTGRVYSIGTFLVSIPAPAEPIIKIGHWIEVAGAKRINFGSLDHLVDYVTKRYPLRVAA